MKLRRPNARGSSLMAAALAASLVTVTAPRAARAEDAAGGGGAPPTRETEARPGVDDPRRFEPGMPASAKLPNPWRVSILPFARNYVVLTGASPDDRIGPFVTGAAPSVRLGPMWRFDMGFAWSSDIPHVTLFPRFREMWLTGPIFSMWITEGIVIPLRQDWLLYASAFVGPGFRWWVTPDLGVFIEALPAFGIGPNSQAVFALVGAVGLEIGLF